MTNCVTKSTQTNNNVGLIARVWCEDAETPPTSATLGFLFEGGRHLTLMRDKNILAKGQLLLTTASFARYAYEG